MDETTIAALLAALAATPDNAALRVAIVRAQAGRGDHAAAADLADRLDAAALAPTDRGFVASVYLGAGLPARAVLLTEGATDAHLLVVRARALHALGDAEAARKSYDAALAANPTVEDADLRAQLTASVREHPPAPGNDGPRLRVIANDDTDRSELARLLQPPVPIVTFADVAGLDDVKRQVEQRIILPFQKPSLFARFKKKAGGGILLYGPPGCGKTLLARATAGQCGATFLNVAIEDVLDMWIGESERKLHALFEKARAAAPAVLFFDELEALAGKRQHTREQHASKLVSQFLSEMDGFAQNNRGVLILGASNVPWAIDPAFRRPGRFDRVVFVPPPDRAARLAILRLHLDGRPADPAITLETIADRTSGFSGADLAHVVDTAADRAIAASLAQGREVPIGQADLVGALTEVKATTAEWLTTARNYARYANEGGQYDDVLDFLARHGKR